MLTPGQTAHFQIFGFLALRGLYSQSEADAIRAESDKVLSRARDSKAFTGKASQTVFQRFERSPLLMSLLEDEPVYGLAKSLLGPPFILVSTEGNCYVGPTQWQNSDVDLGDLRPRFVGMRVPVGRRQMKLVGHACGADMVRTNNASRVQRQESRA